MAAKPASSDVNSTKVAGDSIFRLVWEVVICDEWISVEDYKLAACWMEMVLRSELNVW